MKQIVFNLFVDEKIANSLKSIADCEIGNVMLRQFPDEETYIKIESNVKDCDVILLASLDRPNKKLLPLLFIAETVKYLGAKHVGLIAPYLPYMRQDKQFHPGEGITSKYFAALLSHYFDWLITVDPHLHRRRSLHEIYTMSTEVLHAADKLSTWIKENVSDPIVVGPDKESEQWVMKVANKAGAPFTVLEKIRRDDNEVEISIPHMEQYKNHTPVLVDDIISTARTMIETVKHLKNAKMKLPVCMGIHAIFSGNAYQDLLNAGVEKIITCNTVQHASNEIDLSEDIAQSVIKLRGEFL
ncbi:MAG: ribose-phosphate pyrophosphokinase [Gammaproteobacteria bacterium]|nr:ribose-phosphate pyrophosphokinase [Gammaproteobacteria bacterium]